MTGLQLIVIVIAAVMLFYTYSALRRAEVRGREFIVWAGVWVGLILVSVFSDRFRAIVGPLQVARLLDLVIIAGLILVAVIVLHLNRMLRRLENRLVEMVRELALARSADQGGGQGESTE